MTHISIVIPMYNAREWIVETLDSVRAQTYRRDRLETIIVDDGSYDDGVVLARAFLEQHGLRGTVLVAEQDNVASTARNRGWQAADGDWIQFLDRGEILAPNKIELQASAIEQLPDDVGVICSSWQRVGLPASRPQLIEPLLLELVSQQPGFLASTLIRKASLEAIGGFSPEVSVAADEHLMLKLAGMGAKFVEAPCAAPLLFVHTVPEAQSAHAEVGFARQHLENVLIAATMLSRKRYGTLTVEDDRQVAGLCERSLSTLYEHDRDAFERYWQALRKIVPDFVPRHGTALNLASRLLGYERAEGLALSLRQRRAAVAGSTAAVASKGKQGVVLSYRKLRAWSAAAAASITAGAAWVAQAPHWAALGVQSAFGRLAGALAPAAGTYRVAGAGAVLAVSAVVALAIGASQLGRNGRPDNALDHSRLAEAPRVETSRTDAVRTDAPRVAAAATVVAQPEQTPLRERRLEAAPESTSPARSDAASAKPAKSDRASKQTAAKAAPVEPQAAAATAPPPPQAEAGTTPAADVASPKAAKAERSSKQAASKAARIETKAAAVTGPQPPQADAGPAPAVDVALPKPDKTEQSSKQAVSKVAPVETKVAVVTAPLPSQADAGPTPVTVAASPVKDAAPPIAAAQAKPQPRSATADEPSTNAGPAPTPEALRIPVAKVDKSSKGTTPPVPPAETKAAPAAAPESVRAIASPAPVEAAPLPVTVAKVEQTNTEPAPQAAPAQVKVAPAAAPEPAPAIAKPASAEPPTHVPAAKVEPVSKEPAPQPAPAPAKAAAAPAPEPSRPSTVSDAAAAPPVAVAKPAPASKETAQPVKLAEVKTASVGGPEPSRPGMGGPAAEKPLSSPAAKADRVNEAPAPRGPVLTAEDKERAEKFVARGERDLEDGNVATARQFFLRASTAGLARGALLLASTYDAQELARLRAVGVQPNVAAARQWYERARELGAPEAEARLARLGGG